MFRSLTLGVVQGLTEFVPVSSSGHLVLVPFVLGWNTPGVPFDVAVHLGTALAVIAYFWRDLGALIAGTARTLTGRGGQGDRDMARLAGLLVVGSVPAAVVGILFESDIEELFAEPQLVAGFLVVTALLLVGGEALYRRRAQHGDMKKVRIADALSIGALQAVAIAPGVSRSGATIAAGLARGLSRDAAARFSFLLGLPAILGAGLVQLPDYPAGADLGPVIGASVVAAVVGFLSIVFLLRYVRTRDLRPFAVYAVLAAAVGLAFWIW